MLSCRRTPWRQGLNAVGHDGRDAAAVAHISRIWFVHLFFENQRKKYQPMIL
jgi:hypothetical protein